MYRLTKEEPCKTTPLGCENTVKELIKSRSHMDICSGPCHAEEILQVLNIYRQSGIFTDVVLQVDGKDFPCHRATLSANSLYFKAMFTGYLKECRQDTIEIQKVSASTMEFLLEYMYGRKIQIQEDNVESVLEASDLLQISKLREDCIAFLEEQLDVCNCLGLMKFANTYSIPSLWEKSRKVLLEGFVEVSQHEEFLQLSKEELTEHLSNEQLVTPTEVALFEAVMRWVGHEVSTRKSALKDVLELVRLPLLDPVYFLNNVEMDELIQECKECRPLLLEAKQYQIFGNEVSSIRTRPRKFTDLVETIVIIGGCNKNNQMKLPFMEKYNPSTKEWTTMARIPGYSKSEFASCTLKNDIYVSGGHLGGSEAWRFISQLDIWIRVAALNKGRWRHKMTALRGKLYAVGGYDGAQRVHSVECYNTFSNQWTTVAPLLEPVSSAAVVACMSKLYVIGGAVDNETNCEKVQCYDPTENKWTFVTSTPFSQRCLNAVCIDNIIYVIGGLMDKIYSYSPKKNTWCEAGILPTPLESCGMTVCGGKIYILGGRDENGEGTDNAYMFDPTTGKVKQEPSMQRCISYHGCVSILQCVGS
ncbi:kelch-like protein 35 [Latimeria chalumnae]|uniref:Kelch like family member 35 n=1 Tax=Latimeria chalumnae TaxID=7897 RepID=M3XHE3_LATCH|nr:PREDICTED: kelch-like protein 35 [Latimeria chalumnae]|eukprot:XP_006013535.1 PREDICTED: kelch-like protein 35 [Latimeria chalumnae]